MARTSQIDKPRVACEINGDRVVAARGTPGGGVDIYATRRLPAGAVVPGFAHANLSNATAVRQALSDSLSSVGGGSDVIAVLPDAAVRVLLLDFDSLPEKREEAEGVIRLRLRKSIPFDADDAALSFMAYRNGGPVRAVAALVPRSILTEYESAFIDAGYTPGVVMPSSLAVLGLIEGQRPTMLVKVDPVTTTIAIADRGELVLVRTLDHPGRPDVSAQELADAVHPSVVFFEDTFSSKLDQIVLATPSRTQELAAALHTETGIRASDIGSYIDSGDNLGEGATRSVLAGVTGALAS
jgi:type IV pilus assembly protein PilM